MYIWKKIAQDIRPMNGFWRGELEIGIHARNGSLQAIG